MLIISGITGNGNPNQSGQSNNSMQQCNPLNMGMNLVNPALVAALNQAGWNLVNNNLPQSDNFNQNFPPSQSNGNHNNSPVKQGSDFICSDGY